MAAFGRIHLAAAAVALLLMIQMEMAASSVTDILMKNGLPQGLLPGTVKSYSLSSNGKFQVSLRSTCTAKIGSEEVYYKKSITGELSYRQIKNLGGIQVHAFFWVSVTGIEVDAYDPRYLWFKVGYISKSINANVFQEPPTCNSLREEEEDKDAMTFSDWLSKAFSGTLEVNVLDILDSGAGRRMLQ